MCLPSGEVKPRSGIGFKDFLPVFKIGYSSFWASVMLIRNGTHRCKHCRFSSSLNRNSGLSLQENSIRYSVYSKSCFTNVDVQTVNKAFFYN